jgi:hypothetical protein
LRTTVPISGMMRCSFWASPIWKAVLEHLDDLGNAEGTDEHGHHFDPAVQFRDTEGETRVELEQIAAHAGQKQSQKTGDPALDDQIRAGEGAADQDAEKSQQKELERR